MEIGCVSHKGLKIFINKGINKKLIGDTDRISDMIFLLQSADSIKDLLDPPNFNFHSLRGNKKGYYSMTVSRNWRMTFRVSEDNKIIDLNLEDYHDG